MYAAHCTAWRSGEDLGTETVLRVTEEEQEFVFEGIEVGGP